jgi:hypothetical protein
MLKVMLLALALGAQDSPGRHVRASEPQILALIDAGLSRSATFRSVVATLDASDVIVYVYEKRGREGLGGYMAHRVVARGGYRYLQIALETRGSQGRLVPLLAHELQHAIEIAQSPEAQDGQGAERAVARLALPNGCAGSTCYETQGALNIEYAVSAELKGRGESVPRTNAAR